MKIGSGYDTRDLCHVMATEALQVTNSVNRIPRLVYMCVYIYTVTEPLSGRYHVFGKCSLLSLKYPSIEGFDTV